MENFSWHQMQEDDLHEIDQIMQQTYPHLPEDIDCIRERVRLFPHGCQVLRQNDRDAILGYIISHPWENRSIPPLSSLLGSLPFKAEVYYIHDIALLPESQGIGAARDVLEQLSQVARSLYINKFALVALGTANEFWRARGFRTVHEQLLKDKLRAYGANAHYMQRGVD
ncbi:GNAT family N-acetyltransferase [Pseudovibrio sp. Alg231-02]|uniref:GNAT family N-acetyltransferase n=1 Tax=Pseudovibrio sp. Alg231-02 TaxID=1922223 RepID=UPI000D55940B|nr:GNAT family N-acetyltransferase [Pseudovibrio sp. Alg231-02]